MFTYCVTKSGRVWRKVPESDARSVMSVVSGSTRSDGSALATVTNTGSHCRPSGAAILPAAVAHTERPTQCWQGNGCTDSQPRLGTAVTVLRKVLSGWRILVYTPKDSNKYWSLDVVVTTTSEPTEVRFGVAGSLFQTG